MARWAICSWSNHAPRGLFRAPAWEEMGVKGSVCTAATVTRGLRKGDDIVLTQREMRVSSACVTLSEPVRPLSHTTEACCTRPFENQPALAPSPNLTFPLRFFSLGNALPRALCANPKSEFSADRSFAVGHQVTCPTHVFIPSDVKRR